ncbi:MarR family winged helix-turn-helix transcriptional regulator [Terrabacter sp. GCM10028922]
MGAVTGQERATSPAEDRTQGVTLLYLIKQVELAVRQQLDEVAATDDLTAIQYTALTVLERHPGMTSAALARSSFVRAQTMAEMVTYLLDRGLVTRERDADNRRQYLLSLTTEGQAVIHRLRAPVAAIEEKMVEALDAGQVETLRSYLMRCRRSLNQHPLH